VARLTKRLGIAILICVGVLATAAVAAAQEGAHFTQNGDPVCTDIGLQLECTAELAGLGQQRVVGTISAPGAQAVDNICENKGGGQAPGQNPAVDFTAGGSAVGVVDKNGRAFIDATTTSPSVGAKAAGCPNGNWRVIVGDVVFHDYSFTITQGNQTLFTCTGSFGTEGSSDGDSDSPTCTEA
jgi:hypothetical protein